MLRATAARLFHSLHISFRPSGYASALLDSLSPLGGSAQWTSVRAAASSERGDAIEYDEGRKH